MKYTRFQDIPPFIRASNYRCNVGWEYVEDWIANCNNQGIELDPDFQRAHVWTESQQTRYVEFVLRGGRSSRDIYFNCATWNADFNTPVYLVDGKQRLEAVRKFMRGELRAFGSLKTEYTDRLPVMECDFIFHVNNLATRAEMLQWYIDLNAGGVAHTDEEIGKVRKMLEAEKVSV